MRLLPFTCNDEVFVGGHSGGLVQRWELGLTLGYYRPFLQLSGRAV